MNEDSTDHQSGHISALAMSLTAVIQHLPPAMARAIAQTLRASADVQREADEQESTPPAAAHARDVLLDGWIGLLEAVGQPPA